MGERRSAVNILGVDVGTTHCKAAAYALAGNRLAFSSGPTPTQQDAAGHPYIDPELLWAYVAALIHDAARAAVPKVIGVAGMAEAGLLLDRGTGEPRSEIVPWYDPRSALQASRMEEIESSESGFRRSGLHPSFKYGLAKILWLRDRDSAAPRDAVWLSVPDYIVYRLTGRMVTDPTLAARTYAYCVSEGHWDDAWLGRLRLDSSMFPEVRPSGVPAGRCEGTVAKKVGLPPGATVAVCGHDHLCALIGAGITEEGAVLDSMGTAESLMGVIPHWPDGAYQSGLTVAPSVVPGRYCWLGGLPASGGSIEWLRTQLGEKPVSYEELERLAVAVGSQPTGIVYFPYLSGSGAPSHDQNVRAAFVGLGAEHGRGDLIRAVMEGTAYQTLAIQRAAELLTGSPAAHVVTVGGGTRSAAWLQIKADVTGKRHLVPGDEEAAVRGAAWAAAIGSDLLDLASLPRATMARALEPNPDRHVSYVELYERDFLPMQPALRSLAGSPPSAPSLSRA